MNNLEQKKRNLRKILFGVWIISSFFFGFAISMRCSTRAELKTLPHTEAASLSITCDISNGQTIIPGEIASVNWTVTGYGGATFIVDRNNSVQDFGIIPSDNSYIIAQSVDIIQGWYSLSIRIYRSGVLLDIAFVVFEIKDILSDFWSSTGIVLIAGSVAVSVTVANFFAYRHIKRSWKGTQKSGLDQSPILYPAIADLFRTRSRGAESYYTYRNSCQVKSVWIWGIPSGRVLANEVFQPDLENPDYNRLLEATMQEFIKKILAKAIHSQGSFVTLPVFLNNERLLLISVRNEIIFGALCQNRITPRFLAQLGEASLRIAQQNKSSPIRCYLDVAALVDDHAHISRSYYYVESVSETRQILSSARDLLEGSDPEINDDARNLTVVECAEVIGKIKGFQTLSPGNKFLEEAENLFGK